MKSNGSSQKENRFSWAKRIRSFSFAFKGIKVLFREEHNSWIHLAATITVTALGVWLKFSITEWIMVWLCIGFVFLAELVNTAFENLCDHITPEKNEAIAKIKDLAAAAVLVSALTSAIVGFLIFASRIIQ